MIQDLQAVPGLTGGWNIGERQEYAGNDLQEEQNKAGAAEDVPPARSTLWHGMQYGILDRSFKLDAALYPIVEPLVPEHGAFPRRSVASFESVGICPALISNFPFSTR